jgi:hypothetical protein
MKKYLLIFCLAILLILPAVGAVSAYVAESSNYRIQSDSVNFGGGLGSSDNYNIEDTAGELGTGYSNSGTYYSHAGYQQSGTSSEQEEEEEDDDSGGGGGGGNEGCTDPAATNYDPDAEEDDDSCIYPVPNVSNFVALLNNTQTIVNLTWENPVYNQLAAVRIVRGEGSIPLGPNQGIAIYEGLGEAAIDVNIELNKTYYYVAYVRSNDGRYSSGVLVSVVTTTSACTGDECGEDPGDNPDDGGDNDWPPAEENDPIIGRITLADFKFVQPGEPIKTFRNRDTVRIKGDKMLTVWIESDLFPAALKTIVVTLHDPDDYHKTFSFLLRADASKTRYTGTIGPLLKDGLYPVTIHILNFEDQSLKKIQGRMMVSGIGADPSLPLIIKRFFAPLAVSSGILAGASQLLGVTVRVSSLYDLYLLIMRAFGSLLGFLGIRRKARPWGTVYDAVTKRPIDPAYVVISRNGEEVGSAITDLDGRYGFFLPPGQYDIQAGKTHYTFPSAILAGKKSDELYDNLYFGESVTSSGQEVIARNIPLDPVGFDWNEFVKSKADFFRLTSRRELLKTRIVNTIYAVGFVSTLFASVITPSKANFSILAIYALLYALQVWWDFRHPVHQIIRNSGEPIPYSVLTAYLPGLDQRIKSIVTDQLGRFYMLVPPNTYYFTVEEKLADGSYKLVYKSDPKTLKRGVLNEDLILPL